MRTEFLDSALHAALPAMSVLVRAETAADIDFSASLYALTREAELAAVDWPDEMKRAFCRQQFDAQHAHCRQHYPKAEFLIIERDGIPVGRVYFEHTAKELRLMEITLVEAVRNLGIGGAISDALLQRARAAGIPMSLHVEPFNPARRLYERQGFREVETRGLYLYMVCAPPADVQLKTTS
jgi:GNAT superfamily N-acetyltransferase